MEGQTIKTVRYLVVLGLFVLLPLNARAQWLPDQTLIPPPLIAPRQPYNGVEVFAIDDGTTRSPLSGSVVSLGHQSGAYRFTPSIQLNIEGGVSAHFREQSSDFNLISSDFYVGFPLMITDEYGGWRLAVEHLSSHLGDEFQDTTGAQRISFSLESLRILRFFETDWGEAHAGGEWAISPTPNFEQGTIHAGTTYIGEAYTGGFHISTRNRHDWDPLITARFERRFIDNQLGIGIKTFDGPLPVGQFFRQERSYVGIYLRFYPRFMQNYFNT